MTRINVGVRAKQMTDEHLRAEHREIKRLPVSFAKALSNGNFYTKIPSKFTLGTGHVMFFLNKPSYTLKRFQEIHEECIKRGFKVNNYSPKWEAYEYYANKYDFQLEDYEENDIDTNIIKERISKNVLNGKLNNYRYFSKIITIEEVLTKLFE